MNSDTQRDVSNKDGHLRDAKLLLLMESSGSSTTAWPFLYTFDRSSQKTSEKIMSLLGILSDLNI